MKKLMKPRVALPLIGVACAVLAFTACGNEAPPAVVAEKEKPKAEAKPPKKKKKKPAKVEANATPEAFDPTTVTLTSNQRQKTQWSLFAELLAENDPTKISPTAADVTASPASLTNAIQALWWGTRGETAMEIAKLFGVNPKKAAKAGKKPKKKASSKKSSGTSLGGGTMIVSGASLWVDEAFPLKDSYRDLLKSRGLGVAETVNWSKPGDALGKLNAWGSKVTGGKIPTLLEVGDISPPVAFVLASVVNFKGTWAESFNKKDTSTEDFTLLNGKSSPAAYLNSKRKVRYAERKDGTRLIELPFSGGQQRFVAVLPGKKGAKALRKLERQAAEIPGWISEMKEEEKVAISMPKFALSFSSKPTEALQKLGVKQIFSEKRSDFSGATDIEGLKLDAIRHHAMVTINEMGAEASGATTAIVSAKSFDPGTPSFQANRPFLFMIMSENGELLFGGRVASPKLKSDETTNAGIPQPKAN